MSNVADCKGSWALGTACGTCARCIEAAPAEIRALRNDLEMYVNAWRRELGRYIAPKRHLIDALVVGTQRLVTRVAAADAYRAAFEQWLVDLGVARTIGLPDPDPPQSLFAATVAVDARDG